MVDTNDTISISENTIRGGIVMEDPNEEADPNLCGCEKAPLPPTKCFREGQVRNGLTITAAMVTLWGTLGEPNSWCYDCHHMADIDGDCAIGGTDINGMVGEPGSGWFSAWNVGYDKHSDIDYDGTIGGTDINGYIGTLSGWFAAWNSGGCPVGCTPGVIMNP
jgi:hypothetical protein